MREKEDRLVLRSPLTGTRVCPRDPVCMDAWEPENKGDKERVALARARVAWEKVGVNRLRRAR